MNISSINSNPKVLEEQEKLELKFLSKKALYVNALSLVFAVAIFTFFIILHAPTHFVLSVIILTTFLLFTNLALYANNEFYQNTRLIMYINTLAVYVIATLAIFVVKSASSFTLLFLIYAIVSIYQERKTAILNNIALFFVGAVVAWRHPTIFLREGFNSQIWYIYLFLLVFMVFLSNASFILIKRNESYFKKLAQVKEVEIRTMDIIQDLEKNYRGKDINDKYYYRQIKKMLNTLSKKIGMEDVFAERLDIISSLSTMTDSEIQQDYQKFTLKDIQELRQLNILIHNKIRHTIMKSSQSQNLLSPENDHLKTSKSKSEGTRNTSRYADIISFVVIYGILKTNALKIAQLSDESIYEMIMSSEVRHAFPQQIIDVFEKHHKVFDRIFRDAYSKKVTS